ncbi:MAG: RES domain-containing protein [Alcaligenaceae bacterium]|nr:RES domain-containing protein [Alcaligenaceae bacterium]
MLYPIYVHKEQNNAYGAIFPDIPGCFAGADAWTFVHTTWYPTLPLMITRFILPDDEALYFEPNPSELPQEWSSLPADRPGMTFRTEWLQDKTHLGLIVPSAVLPLERNIVINPRHPAISEVRVDEIFDFMYDERMFLPRR